MPAKKQLSTSSLLKAPGAGLLSVSTGTEKAQKLQKKYFKNTQLKNWPQYAEKLLKQSSMPLIVGYPSDAGGSICRGSAHGPLALREKLYQKKAQWIEQDLGDIPCIPQLQHDEMLSSAQKKKSGLALWGKSYKSEHPVAPLSLLKSMLSEAYKNNSKLRFLTLGGDHSLSWAPLKALHENKLTKNMAVLHLDAHTDLMSERFGVSYCFATWAAHISKLLNNKENFVQVGLRRSGKTKQHWEKNFPLKQYWMKDLQKRSPEQCAQEISKKWKKKGIEKVYVSLDIDALDSNIAPSTGTPEENGMSLSFAKKLVKEITQSFSLVGADLVEVAPVLGSPANARKTVKAGVDLIQALHWH